MAQFDMSKAVRNLLSGGGETAQERVTDVIKNSTDMTRLPAVDVGKLANLPGVGDALGGVGGSTRNWWIQAPRVQAQVQKSKKDRVQLIQHECYAQCCSHGLEAHGDRRQEGRRRRSC